MIIISRVTRNAEPPTQISWTGLEKNLLLHTDIKTWATLPSQEMVADTPKQTCGTGSEKTLLLDKEIAKRIVLSWTGSHSIFKINITSVLELASSAIHENTTVNLKIFCHYINRETIASVSIPYAKVLICLYFHVSNTRLLLKHGICRDNFLQYNKRWCINVSVRFKHFLGTAKTEYFESSL